MFKCSIFPERMKIAKIVHLLESGDPMLFTNYRPMYLNSQFSKILEKLFDARLQKFIEKHEIFHLSQYEFRAKRCTGLDLMELVEEICEKKNNKKKQQLKCSSN